MQFIVVVALACVAAVAAKPGATYTDKWDNINVEDILGSDRLLKGYVDCLNNKGRCTPDGNTLKETLPDALENECSKCTTKQKEGADKVIKFLVNKKPEVWKELAVIYDPDNKYQARYKDRIDAARSA